MSKVKILVVFYSTTGNVAKLGQAVADGAKGAGAEVRLRQVQELIPKDKFNDVMRKVRKQLKDIPIATNDDLVWADGVAFGTPTRYGKMSAQMSQFIDHTGNLWMEGALVDKVATVFTSASTQHGGHEVTQLTSFPPLLAHGMIVIGVPYTEQRLMSMELGGGGPLGASSVSGPMADRPPTKNDLEIAMVQGKRLADITKRTRG